MSFAILGWGSLIWNPRGLAVTGNWETDGPEMAIEFTRISNDGRLTLVIDERNGTVVPTLFVRSAAASLDNAINNLRLREGITDDSQIGFFHRASGRMNPRSQEKHPNACAAIQHWTEARQFEGVIWTALGPRFKDVSNIAWSPEAAVRYVDALPDDQKTKAYEYIRKAPTQVMTRFRRLFDQTHPQAPSACL